MRLKHFQLTVLCSVLILSGTSAWGSVDKPVSTTSSELPGEFVLAKDIDIHLEKKTQPEGEQPDIKLERKMPEPPVIERGIVGEDEDLDEFEDDPFASDEEDKAQKDEDNLEGVNRAVHDVNDTIYQYFFRPLARGYRDVMPEDGRSVVRNLFDNLKAPAKLVSSIIQGDADKSGRVVSRFLINTTAGMGGMLDVAGEEYEIKNVNEDFGQALASQGVGSGDYIVLPFFGPSTTRDVVGKVVDNALNPTTYFGIGFLANAAISTTERVNETSYFVDDIDQLNDSAIDPYEAQRHFYLELREKQIKE